MTVQNFVDESLKKEKLDLIFDRFYRMDESRNSDVGGHGIGLSIAKAIVSAHKGKIFVDCSDDCKNIFKIMAVFPV